MKGLKKKTLLSDPTQIDPMSYSTGILSKKTLDLKEIERDMRTTYKDM